MVISRSAGEKEAAGWPARRNLTKVQAVEATDKLAPLKRGAPRANLNQSGGTNTPRGVFVAEPASSKEVAGAVAATHKLADRKQGNPNPSGSNQYQKVLKTPRGVFSEQPAPAKEVRERRRRNRMRES